MNRSKLSQPADASMSGTRWPRIPRIAAVCAILMLTLGGRDARPQGGAASDSGPLLASVRQKYQSNSRSQYSFQNFSRYELFPQSRTLHQGKEAWGRYFEILQDSKPSTPGRTLDLGGTQARPGDVILIETQTGTTKPLVLIYAGEESFPEAPGRKRSFFYYPYVYDGMELNTFPPRIRREHLTRLKLVKAGSDRIGRGADQGKAVRWTADQERSATWLKGPKLKVGNRRTVFMPSKTWKGGATYLVLRAREQPAGGVTSTPERNGSENIQSTIAWDNTKGGLKLYVQVSERATVTTPIEVYWSRGSSLADRIGTPVYRRNVVVGTEPKRYGPLQVSGEDVKVAPVGATHLIVVTGQNVAAVPDVRVTFGANADRAVVSSKSMKVLKELLRVAGQPTASITSTARSPADQARVMFQNLTKAGKTIEENIADQIRTYAAPGEAVVGVFTDLARNKTRQQILAAQSSIRLAMLTEINRQGPGRVSKHCGDPATTNVLDISANAFTAANGSLFWGVADRDPRVKILDERNENGCYHLEVPQ